MDPRVFPVCGIAYPMEFEYKPVCNLAPNHAGPHIDSLSAFPATLEWTG